MDELKADAPLEVYSLTHEEMEILVVSQRRRIKQLEFAIKHAGSDIEREAERVNEMWERLQERTRADG